MSRAITGLSSMATRAVLADLAAAFEARTGQRVAIESVGGVDAAKRVRAGEPVDLVVLAAGVMKQLEADGLIVAGSLAGIALSRVAAAVPDGVAVPDMSSPDAAKAATLAARAIAYSTGPSGDQLKRLWQTWGIADAIAGRLVQAPPGVPVATLLARGEADLGFQQMSELLGAPGITIAGHLPTELDLATMFTAGIGAACADGDAARSLLAFMAGPDAAGMTRRHGMEPA